VTSLTHVRVEAAVSPTEDAAKIKSAVLNVFPDARFTETEGVLLAESNSLDRLKEMLRNERIRDSARMILLKARRESTIRFSLNKEAAFVGRVNFAPPSPMGPIDVVIVDENVDSVIESLTGKSEPSDTVLSDR